MVRALALSLAVSLTLLTFGASPSRADVPRQFARLERVEVEPYLVGLTRVRAFVNLLQMEGALIDNVKPEELGLIVGDARLRNIPGISRFENSGDLLDLAVIIELHPSFVSALEDLEEPVGKLISRLPADTTRVSIVGYGERVKAGPLEAPAAAGRRWRRLSPDDTPEKPKLVEALQKTVRVLGNATPLRPASSVRRVVLVISDGVDMDVQGADTRDDFRKVWKQANDAGVTIHTLGFSLVDNRIPLQNLGEISKKTAGTFRWAQTRADFGPYIDLIADELRRQMVLTFLIPGEQKVDVGTSLTVVCKSAHCEGTLTSNPRRAPKMMCAGRTCDTSQACIAEACKTVQMTGPRGSMAAIMAAFIGLAFVGGMGVLYMKKLRHKADDEADEAAPGTPGAAFPVIANPQVVVPDFSNMPYVGNSAAVQQMQQQLAHLPYVGQALAQQQAAAQAAQRAAAPPVAVPGRPVPQIMVLSGPHAGKSFPLRHGFTVGKQRGCDLLVEDGFTSAHHAQFHIDLGGGCSVVDLGSTNGTFVNGVRTTQQRLAHGMSVRIGQTEVRFLHG